MDFTNRVEKQIIGIGTFKIYVTVRAKNIGSSFAEFFTIWDL